MPKGGKEIKMTVLKVEAMHCPHCVARIEKALSEAGLKFSVSLEKKTVTIDGCTLPEFTSGKAAAKAVKELTHSTLPMSSILSMLRRLDYVITTAEIRRIERQSAIWHTPIVAHGMTFKTLQDACQALRLPYDKVKYERKKRDMTGQEVIDLFLARNVK